jgi:lipopolysaccharide/colanic/teichoic acid biosynthesis glycosyltransferase
MNTRTAIRNEPVIRPKTIYKPAGRDGAYLPASAELHHAPSLARPDSYVRLKRVLDVAIAAGLLVAMTPILLIAALLVRLTSNGPAIYVQTRLGRRGLPFRIFKLRTMYDNCESLTGPRWAVPGDPRVTPLGAILRATHFDELPQLWNVIRGDMSLIGPRPERPEIIEQLEKDMPDYGDRHVVRPGITGLAQIQLPPDTDVANVADKLVLDKAYIHHLGPRLDLQIIVCTALRMVGLPPRRLRAILGRSIPSDFTPGHAIHRYGRRKSA